MSEEPPPSHQLVFNRSDNAFFGPFPESGWDELIVWGGCVANCGEGTLSRLVDTNAAHLRSLIYMPTRTKGGVLIRPKYHCGDRGGRQSFPQLERMAIRLSPLVQPLQYGWETPALRELTLLIDQAPTYHAPHKLDLASALSAWDQDEFGFLRQLHANCPNLECIHIDLCSSDDDRRRQARLLTISTPNGRVLWPVLRLLKLVEKKADPDAEGVDSVERCHNALRQAMPVLWPLLARSPWSLTPGAAGNLPARVGGCAAALERLAAISATLSWASEAGPPPAVASRPPRDGSLVGSLVRRLTSGARQPPGAESTEQDELRLSFHNQREAFMTSLLGRLRPD